MARQGRKLRISLRGRVLAAVGLTLAFSLSGGAYMAGLRAKDSLRAELESALAGAQKSAVEPFGDLRRSDHAALDVTRFAQSFDGSRHLRAVAMDGSGRILSESRPERPASPAPPWFGRLMRTAIAPVEIDAPGGGRVRLEAVEANDLADAWSELSRMIAAFAVFSLAGAAAVYAVIGAALAPLAGVSAAFQRIGEGDYGVRLATGGVSELERLTVGLNAMAERLSQIDRRNRSLEEQLLTLQDEERAGIAQDLHDEIGPYLFAVSLDASLAERLSREDRNGEVRERLASIKSAVDHMQRQVQDLLHQLRPSPAVELGLAAALADAVEFWRGKRPDIAFELDLDPGDESIEPRQAEALWRVAQEALSNAVRHGRARVVTVRLDLSAPESVELSVDDDGGAGPAEPRPGSGFGLRGMRERMAACGGQLSISAEPGRGWIVRARCPTRRAAVQAAGSDLT